MHRTIYILFVTILFFSTLGFAQTVNYTIQQGSIDTGAVVNTGTFSDELIEIDPPFEMGLMNNEYNPEPMMIDPQGAPMYESMYFEDVIHTDQMEQVGDDPLLITKFNQTLPNNVAPPDPTIAVGPNHVMVLTNHGTGIYIYDKQGNLVKSLSSTSWWSAVWPSQSGDPQILFDHFSNRWVMVFMQVDDGAQTAGNLLAFSDDDDPIGTWYMYRLDTKMHGTTPSSTWGDYPQIGYDDKAIYIMTRLFGFGGGFFGTKVRIINKSELYSGNAGPLTYTDMWNITMPGGTSLPDVIHPSFHYTSANEHYLLFASRTGGNFYSLYKIADPIGNPVLTGTNIIVPFFGETPTAGQLGTSTRIESNGSHIKTAPVFKDGYLYATHSIRNSQHPAYASVKYTKINVATNAIDESYELGAEGYYYIFPAIAVDQDDNVIITCSRSADDEYPGAYFLGRRDSDPPGLSNSFVIQEGLASYVCSFCGTRNRWGDYLGAYIDFSSEDDFWMVSQYAASQNTYAVSIGHVRLKPYAGVYPFFETLDYDLGSVELGDTSDVVSVYIANYGDSPLVISSMDESAGDFHRVSSFTFPLNVNTYDTIKIDLVFVPTSEGSQSEVLGISSNSPELDGLNLDGVGYIANPAESRVLYAISSTQNDGNLSTIDLGTGAGVNVGPSGYSDIFDIEIHNESNKIIGLRSLPIASEIYSINAAGGDAYLSEMIEISELYSLAYDTLGTLYGTARNGDLFTIDTDDWSFDFVATLMFERVAIAFNPLTNEMWGVVKNAIGQPRDRVVKFDAQTGDTLMTGQTGFGINTTDIIFDETGTLYGVKGTGNVESDLFIIDQTTGTGTLIASTGIKDIRGIGYSLNDQPVSVESSEDLIPSEFTLSQNYPNPFNPSTKINFTLPQTSDIKLTVYNLLGQTVKVLIDNQMNAGSHSVLWNADDNFGNKVSSGVYFYELKAGSDDGSNFNQIRKMVFLK